MQETTYPDIDVLILAAGLSSRMGKSNKLLMPLNGEPLVTQTVRLYSNLGMKVSVVVGHQRDKVRAALDGIQAAIITNEDYQHGHQSSVVAGLRSASLRGAGLLVALSDQPLLTCEDVSALCDAFIAGQCSKIFVPYFKGERGNPVLFPMPLIQDLLALSNSPNLKEFIDQNDAHVERYRAPNHHFTFDIDTPDDVERFKSRKTFGS